MVKKVTKAANRPRKRASRRGPLAGSVAAVETLEHLDGSLTFGKLLRAIREGEELSLAKMADKLGVPRSNLWEIEHGLRAVSIARAAAWAKVLGYGESQFVELAVQAALDAAGIKLRVRIEVAA